MSFNGFCGLSAVMRALLSGLCSRHWDFSALPSLGSGAGFRRGAGPAEYRDIPGIGSRNIVWVIAQLHLLLAGFVSGRADLCLVVRNRRLEIR